MDQKPAAQRKNKRPLCGIADEKDYHIAALEGSREYCRHLREMGIRERAGIRVVQRGRNYVCLVSGIRVALSERYVSCILVDRMG